MLNQLWQWLFGRPLGAAQPERSRIRRPPDAVSPQVMVLNFDPPLPAAGGQKLSRVLGWGDTGRLTERFMADLAQVSGGYCRYEIAVRVDVPAFPLKVDGFAYTAEQFVGAWRARQGFHQPDQVDYQRLLADHDVLDRVANEQIDEVWLFGFPHAGFYESCMAGPGAFWCNGPPLEGTDRATRRFIVMGFNYERGVGEMLEAYGHRAESILTHLFRHRSENLWSRFIRHEKSHPGRAEVGTIHYAPNSERDYDWGNPRPVMSRCDNWYRFPDLGGPPRQVDCREWGGGDTRQHHLWWLDHLPRVEGSRDGIAQNWWQYIVDPNQVD